MSHTPTPWVLRPCGEANNITITTTDNNWLMAIQHNGEQHAVVQQENARRIVACVNACEGIETDIFENNVGKVSILLNQRDELLAALKALKTANGANNFEGWHESFHDAIELANTAISNAEGESK